MKPFGGQRYYENMDKCGKYEPCVICGKAVKNPKYGLVVIDGGASWGDENSDPNPPDNSYMGMYPIGPDCLRKYKTEIGKVFSCATAQSK